MNVKKIKNVIIAFAVCVIANGFAQKSQQIKIPFTMDRNLIIIKAKIIKNETHSFIFDTGTEGIMLSDYIADKFKVSGLDSMFTPNGEFVETKEKVLIPKIEFKGLTLKNKNVTKTGRQMIFSNYAIGIIGMQTFAGYMITLDYKNNEIILNEGSLLQESNILPISLNHILEAKVKLNSKEVLAHFDCGGAGYISIPKSWNNIYKLKNEPILTNKGRTPMGDFEAFKAELDGDIEIGSYIITNPKINLVTGDFFFAINFGYEFFKKHLITIDTKNKLMQIKII